MIETAIELQALITERESMLAANNDRIHRNESLAYAEDSFLILADKFRALKSAELAATDSQQLQAAIARVKEYSSEYADCGEDHETLKRLLAVLEQRAAV